jgi:predicted DNA-binding protein
MVDNIQRQIRLTREQDDELRRLAYEQRVSVAEVVRQIIERYLSEEKKPK